MSEIKTQNVSWNNIKVDQYTDISTGYTYITLPGQTGKLAESSSASWTINDINTLTRIYNAANLSTLTTDEVKALFFRSGRLVYNKVREDTINDRILYPDVETFELWMGGMFNNRIPGAVNPVDGRSVNDTGKATTTNTFNTSVTKISTFQTRTSGSPVVPSSFQNSNYVQLASTGNENTYKRSNTFGTMRYPAARLDGYDYISISAHKYSPRGNSSGGGIPNLVGGSSSDRLGTRIGEVQLPMQPNIQEATSVGWGRDTINALQAGFAGVAFKTIDDVSDGQYGAALQSLVYGTGDQISALLKNPNTAAFAKAYFAGQAVGANITARATGTVINPNLELLFSGPSLRDFRFNFTLTPRDEGEASTIKQMIRFFKTNMAPRKGGQNLFLYVPNIFKIKYIYNGGEEHPYMNRLKPCALKAFTVDYTPDSTYNTYDGGSMTRYAISMSFGELEPIYQEDQNNVGGTGY